MNGKNESKRCSTNILLSIGFLLLSLNCNAQEGIEYGENYVVFEAEATSSPLGDWILRTPDDATYQSMVHSGLDAMKDTYLQDKGTWGTPTSPLSYTFTCPKTGNYRLLIRMHSPLNEGEGHDKKNDVFVKLEGNYTSQTTKPKTELEKFHKFWGRGPNKWGVCHSLEIGNHVPAIYGLMEGEEYVFTMAGRSTNTCIDYILFYEDNPAKTIANEDLALQFPVHYRPGQVNVPPTGLNMVPDTTDLRVGTSMQLFLEWEPWNAIKDVVWTSSDEQIVSVDNEGMITALGTIGQTATISASSSVTDTVVTSSVTLVEWYPISVDSISLSPENDTLAEGTTLKIEARVLPYNADDPSLTWSSSDESVATVDENGIVTTLTTGSVDIRATSVADGSIFAETSLLVVQFVAPSVAFDDNSKYLNTTYKSGGTMPVTINYHAGTFQTVRSPIKVWLREIKPGWTVEKDVFYKELEEYVGTNSGTINISIPLDGVTPSTQLPSGNFYFLFTKCFYTNGAEVDVGLSPIKIGAALPIENVTIEPETDTVYVGSTITLTAGVIPANTDEDKSITWTSSNSTVASVTQNGVVSGMLPGKVTITARSKANTSIFAAATVEVIDPNQTSFELLELENVTIYPNPVSGETIQIRGLEQGEYVLRIYNCAGIEISSSSLRTVKEQAVNIHVGSLSSGLYYIRFESAKYCLSKSFLTQ